MLHCHWEEVHYFIQRERDDTEDILSSDKILINTMNSGVKESHSRPFKYFNTNELPDISRKPKMKVKAAKVFKYLLNFLQMKPKKFEDKEKLCIPSTPQDSYVYENPESYECGRLQTPNSSSQKSDGILSMSWSYLVHDPFKEMPNLEEESNEIKNEMFYNDSYFEDDYCQDFREKEWVPFRTPAADFRNVSYSSRLFEPERTPCGEYRRSVVARATPCRRHASLPNFLVDDFEMSSPKDHDELGSSDDSNDLMNVDNFMINHPPVGLNIAFDNLLEETNCESILYSANPLPLVAREEVHQFGNNIEGSLNETYMYQHETSGCFVSETSSERTPYNSCIARDSFHKLHVSGHSGESVQDTDEVLVYNVQTGIEKLQLDTLPPTNVVSRSHSLTHNQCLRENTSPIKGTTKKYGSVESGYSSCESSPSLESSPVMSESAIHEIKFSNPYILPTKMEVSVFNTGDYLINKQMHFSNAIFQQTPHRGQTKTARRRDVIRTNPFQTSTSSPMQIINTPTFLNPMSLPTMISPIKQNVHTPKTPFSLNDSNGSLKSTRHHPRNKSIAKVYSLQSQFLETNAKTDKMVRDLSCDDLLVATAAELILSRIQAKEELQRYMKKEELVAYLKSYYMKEIATLSNRNVRSISDYRKITNEACNTFTTERLTPANSYRELMVAILANRIRIVLACEGFIFENYNCFIRSQDFFEAAPEIILMLICNNRSTIFGTSRLPLRFGESGHELNTYMNKYIEKQRTDNSRIYFRVKNLFTCILKKRTDLTKENPLAQKINLEITTYPKVECATSKNRGQPTNSHSSEILGTPNILRQPLQTLCKGTRMFRNKQILFKTQGNVPETTQKLLDYVNGRKTPHVHRSSHKSKASIHNTSQMGRRYSVNVGKYNLLSNTAVPSQELNPARIKSSHSVSTRKSIPASMKFAIGRPSVKYVTDV